MGSYKEHGKTALSSTLREAGDIVQWGHGKIQMGKGLGTRKVLKRMSGRKRNRDIYDGGAIA